MRIAMRYFICARELFSIWLFHRKLAFVLVKFSLCLDENAQENFLLIFVCEEAERDVNLIEPAGSASNKIFGVGLLYETDGDASRLA